jgi:hypothetical protein
VPQLTGSVIGLAIAFRVLYSTYPSPPRCARHLSPRGRGN